MKKSRFTDSQIMEALKRAEADNIGPCKLFCVSADGTLIGNRAADRRIQ
jgi:hypothetical protein